MLPTLCRQAFKTNYSFAASEADVKLRESFVERPLARIIHEEQQVSRITPVHRLLRLCVKMPCVNQPARASVRLSMKRGNRGLAPCG